MHHLKLTIWIALLMAAAVSPGWAGALALDAVGVRGGFSTRPSNDTFVQTELFTDLNLPWRWHWGRNWEMLSQLNLSAGWLTRQGEDAFIGSLGPQLHLRRNSFPLELTGGLNFTVLSRSAFGDWNLGSHAQFTSHVGVHWQATKHWEIGYRLQHLSNGGFSRPNPGLNMHMFLVSYHF